MSRCPMPATEPVQPFARPGALRTRPHPHIYSLARKRVQHLNSPLSTVSPMQHQYPCGFAGRLPSNPQFICAPCRHCIGFGEQCWRAARVSAGADFGLIKGPRLPATMRRTPAPARFIPGHNARPSADERFDLVAACNTRLPEIRWTVPFEIGSPF